MNRPPNPALLELIDELRGEVQRLSARVADLEQQRASAAAPTVPAAPTAPAPAAPAKHDITEDDLLAISAAVAAFLGVRAQIRQVRLVQSAAWAQVGRATIHATHRAH